MLGNVPEQVSSYHKKVSLLKMLSGCRTAIGLDTIIQFC